MTEQPQIELQGVSKRFGDIVVLDNLSLKIFRGETFILLGRSGVGKSVFLRHLIGLCKPDAGHIFVDGVDIVPLPETKLEDVRAKFGMVFQSSAMLNSLTLEENCALGLVEGRGMKENEARERVREALAAVGLEKHGDRLPEQVSGGMRRRAAIARALVMDPEILLFDEPTAGLDPIMADAIDNLIADLKRRYRKTCIVVTHDMTSAFRLADRIGMLDGGKFVEVGPPEEIRHSTSEFVQQFISRETKAKAEGR